MLTFAVLIGIGASLGVWQVARNAPLRQIERWVDAALLTLLLALIGARGAHVALEWSTYADRLIEIPQFWLGGLAWSGAVLGWLAGVLLFWRLQPIALGAAADGLAHLITPLVVGVWLGCWQSGCAYGPVAPVGAFWGLPAPDEAGVVAARLPLQLVGAMLMLAYEWLCVRFLDLPDGTGLYAALMQLNLAATIFLASLWWVQPTRQAWGLPLDSWLALGVGLPALMGVGWVMIFKRKREKVR